MSYKITKERLDRKVRQLCKASKVVDDLQIQVQNLAEKLQKTCPHTETDSFETNEVCVLCNKTLIVL